MDTSKMKRPEELPFPVTDDVRDRINDLIGGLDRDVDYADMLYDELRGSLRDLTPEQDDWAYRYYILNGWMRGGVRDAREGGGEDGLSA